MQGFRGRKRRHCELTRQQRQLQNENRSGRGTDGKQRLREPDSEDFVVHLRSPKIELIERC
jgi:hypothetical protein